MCDDEETTNHDRYKCVNNCDGNCSSGDLIPVEITLQYRSLNINVLMNLLNITFVKDIMNGCLL